MAGSSRRRVRVAYAIFEGGGARGISHVGALRALEDLNVAIIGVAGASAGAIIAALVAVGYRADDMLEPTTGNHLLARYGSGPIDLLGRSAWQQFERLRRIGRPTVLLLALSVMTTVAAALTPLPAFVAYLAWIAMFIRLGFDLLPLAWSLLNHRGLFATDGVAEIVNRALLDKLAEAKLPTPPDGFVRFRDMPESIPLKIIVSDIFGRQLRLFDARATPNAVVADAVAASAAIPFFFKPPTIRGVANDLPDVYADGGLVSNLPAWAFERDKRAVERYRPELGTIPIYACELRQRPVAATAAGWGRHRLTALLQHLTGTLETGIFGSQALVQRFVSELTVLPVETTLKTLGFDCGIDEARAAYEAGRASVDERLKQAYDEEVVTQALLKAYAAGAAPRISNAGIATGARLRAYVVGRIDDRYQVISGVGMELDADDRMVFDDECPLAPAAAKRRDDLCFAVGGLDPETLAMTRQEYALLRRDLHSVIAIPVFDAAAAWDTTQSGLRPSTTRVLCLDCDQDLAPAFRDQALRRWLRTNSVLLSAKAIRTQVEESRREPADL